MFKKLCFLTFFVLVVFLSSASFGVPDPCVIGSWEVAGDPEGWIDWGTGEAVVGPKYEWVLTGATQGSGALKLQTSTGVTWEQNLSIKLQGRGLVGDFFANTVFAIDVSVPGDAIGSGSCELYTVSLNADVYGWNDLDADEEKPHYQWVFPDDGKNLQTVTMWWNYSESFDTLPPEPGYVEFILATVSDTNGHDTFYFDNARLIDANYPYLPSPADTATDVSIETDLNWMRAADATYHDIYFGSSYAEVNDANNNDAMGEGEIYRAHQDAGTNTYIIPETLDIGEIYYWRIDGDTGSEVLKGAVWSFETQCKAKEPYPANYAIEVERILELSWEPGFPGASHDVYIGTDFSEVDEADSDDPMGPTEVYRARQDVNDTNYAVPETLAAGTIYYWRIDEFNDPCSLFFKGHIWSFTTLNPNARDPYPSDGSTGIYINTMKLIWAAGPFAASHDVYFSTNYNDVVNADDNDGTGIFRGNQLWSEYDLGNLDAFLELETTYYWRIDEVNNSHPDHNWPGPIWSFTIPDYITIDNFEDYTVSGDGNDLCPYYDEDDMRYVWIDGHVQKNPQGDCGSGMDDYNPMALEGGVGRLPGSRIIRTDIGWTGYGLSYYYNNYDVDNEQFPPEPDAYEDRYSEIIRFYPDGVDLTADGKLSPGTIPAIEISYIGNPANSNDPVYDRMYIVLEDMDQSASLPYNGDSAQIDNPDPNAAQAIQWTQWPIVLSDFTDINPDLDLDDIRCIRIGFGKRFNLFDDPPGGEGTVKFDNIRLYGPHCVLSRRGDFAQYDFGPAGNPTGDCVVNYEEIAVMGDDWLAEDDNIETSDPCDIGLVAYYPMDEGNGDTVADDTGDPCHEGTFSAEGVSWVTPGVAGGNCVHVFGDGSSPGARITIGDWNPAEGTGQLTLSMWVRWAGPRYPTGGQPQGLISKRGGWNEESVMFMLEMDTPDSEDTRGSFAFRPFSGDYAVWSEGGIMDVLIGRWAHLAATFDGTTSETAARLYLNGQEVASGQFAFGGGSGEDIYITIGNNNDSSWEDCPGVFNGDIDEVRFYNRALSGAEIAYLADLRTNPDDGKLHVEILSNAELYAEEDEGERIINFYDYARLLEHWLEEVEWQP